MDGPVARTVQRSLGALLLAACAGSACVVPLPAPRSGGLESAGAGVGGDEDGACADTQGQRVVELVNAIRRREGLAPLLSDRRVIAAALAHARDQAATGRMTHVGTDGSTPADRLEAAGYDWARVEENVAAGQASASDVVAAWMRSARHRATILSSDITHVGVGHVRNPTAQLVHFWAMDVAEPRWPDASGVLACHP